MMNDGKVNSIIGQFLLSPGKLRALAKERLNCPEGDCRCGMLVWDLDLGAYERTI